MLKDGDGLAVHVVSADGIASAGTGTNIQRAGGQLDLAGNSSLFGLLRLDRLLFRSFVSAVQLDVLQADPALVNSTPDHAANGLLLQDLNTSVIGQAANYSIGHTGIAANIQVIGSYRAHNALGSGHILFAVSIVIIVIVVIIVILGGSVVLVLEGFIHNIVVVGIFQSDPALAKFTPSITTTGGSTGNYDLLTHISNTHAGIGCAGTTANVNGHTGDLNSNALQKRVINGVLNIAQVDPTHALYFSPLNAVGIGVFGNNLNQLTLNERIYNQSALYRLFKDVKSGGNDLLSIIHRLSGNRFNRSILRISLSLTGAPVGIQHIAVHAGVKLLNLFAAGRIRVPSLKNTTIICSSGTNIHGLSVNIALNIGGRFATITIEGHIAELLGRSSIVYSIQINIGLGKSATAKASKEHAARVAPLTQCTYQIITRPAFDKRCANNTRNDRPGAADIVREGDHRIKLLLGGLQTELINEGINALSRFGEFFKKKLLRLFLGDTLALVALQMLIGGSGAIANGPLAIIPVGLRGETFPIFDQFDQLVTGDKIGRFFCSQRAEGKQAGQQNQGNK